MPHSSSAKKRARQYEKRRAYNRTYKKEIKDSIKTFLAATPDKAAEEFKKAVRKLDKAAARRVIHPNKAARKKAQLETALKAKSK